MQKMIASVGVRCKSYPRYWHSIYGIPYSFFLIFVTIFGEWNESGADLEFAILICILVSVRVCVFSVSANFLILKVECLGKHAFEQKCFWCSPEVTLV